MLLITGVVIGMAVAAIQSLATGVQIALLVFALALVVIGLVLNRKFRSQDS
jgi:hydrogenase-4 membrane subunit HyfE